MPQKSLPQQKRKQLRTKDKPSRPKKDPHASSNPSTSSPAPGLMQAKAPSAPPLPLPTALQTLVLRIYAHALPTLIQDPVRLHETIQSVKSCLYHRDFVGAFETEENREAYALRWSVTRAAGYAAIMEYYAMELGFGWEDEDVEGGDHVVVIKFGGVHLEGEADEVEIKPSDDAVGGGGDVGRSVQDGMEGLGLGGSGQDKQKASQTSKRVVCLGGGGGAEMIALAASSLSSPSSSHAKASSDPQFRKLPKRDNQRQGNAGLDVTIVDSADWRAVTDQLYNSFIELIPKNDGYDGGDVPLSHSAINADDELSSSNPFIKPPLFLHLDLLHDLDHTTAKSLFADADLITICFTLNELCSASMSRMTKLMLALTDSVARGSRLCVVDSPGSYATVKLGEGGKERAYPMGWLLDWVLMDVAASSSRVTAPESGAEAVASEPKRAEGKVKKWEKLVGEDSNWFRWAKDEGLQYEAALKLEDMRFQVHVYRRV